MQTCFDCTLLNDLVLKIGIKEGLEILKIFKGWSAKSSILNDFEFYENQEKVLQARKSRRVWVVMPSKIPYMGHMKKMERRSKHVHSFKEAFQADWQPWR